MTCRVNDSYDISLRMNAAADTSYVCHGTMRKPMFQHALEKSLLDQSLLNLKQSQTNDNQFSSTPGQTP